jgi:hypothetical protein
MGGLDGGGRRIVALAFSCTPIQPLGFYFDQSNIVG